MFVIVLYMKLSVIHNYGNIWNCFSLNMELGEILYLAEVGDL
jgi:hypothetical protein